MSIVVLDWNDGVSAIKKYLGIDAEINTDVFVHVG